MAPTAQPYLRKNVLTNDTLGATIELDVIVSERE